MRIYTISILALASVTLANAGAITAPVQIGGTTGLTATYIASGCAGAGPCVSGSAGSFQENNYDIKLFQSAAGAFTPYTTYNQTTAEKGTLGPNGQFSVIDDTAGANGSNNIWYARGTNAIDVPIGLTGVGDAWLMLNDLFGMAGQINTVLTFDFANTSNGATVDQLVVDLTNSGAGGSAPSGEIQSAVDCSSSCSSGGNTFASGPTLSSGTITNATLNGLATTVAFTTENVFTSAYTSAGGAYAGTSGNVNLDAIDFQLGAFSGLYLTQILVQDQSGANNVSQVALSAITVDPVDPVSATPEPSTLVMLLAGLGAIGYGSRRKKILAR